MNTAELLQLIDKMYPNADSVSDKIMYMNVALNVLSPFFGLIAEDDSLKTVINQDAYSYPANIKNMSQIVSIGIGNSATPTNRYDYTLYKLNTEDDNPMSYNGYFNIVDSAGAKKFVIYPIPTTVDLPIVIKYRMPLTSLTAGNLDAEPEFDYKYHPMLAYYCLNMLCRQGSSPDAYQADSFLALYNDMYEEIWYDKMTNDKKANTKRMDNPQWHKAKSYARGD